MTYNFVDEPSPVLPSYIDPSSGSLVLENGSPQGDLITKEFTGSAVSVSITPPRGWTLDQVTWPSGGSGTFSIPEEGVEESHSFTYTVSQNGTSLTDGGQFKIKKQSNGGDI